MNKTDHITKGKIEKEEEDEKGLTDYLSSLTIENCLQIYDKVKNDS